jgi:hypothetical protein
VVWDLWKGGDESRGRHYQGILRVVMRTSFLPELILLLDMDAWKVTDDIDSGNV